MNLSQIRDLNAVDPIETELGNSRIGGFGELWDACRDKVPLATWTGTLTFHQDSFSPFELVTPGQLVK